MRRTRKVVAGITALVVWAGAPVQPMSEIDDLADIDASTRDLTCYAASPGNDSTGFSFQDATGTLGPKTLLGRYGHGAAWGDVDNDTRPDLFLGTYAAYPNLMLNPNWNDPKNDYRPDQLLLNRAGGFQPDRSFPEIYGWTSGQAFVDVDRDGDNDLIISKYGQDGSNQTTAGETVLLRNDASSFRIVPGAIPRDDDARTGGRSVGVLDFDADGYLDLFFVQDRYGGGRSSLLRNPGTWTAPWQDVTVEAGLPRDVEGFGVSTEDLTGDGLGDLFVVGQDRVFVALGNGKFRESRTPLPVAPLPVDRDDFYTGVTTADLNRDGRNDVLLGAHHVNPTFPDSPHPGVPPVRLLVNRGTTADGDPVFTEETVSAGLPEAVKSKSATVHVVDVDNDGLVDIVAGVARSLDRPAIFRNTSVIDSGGVPRFAVPEGVGATTGVNHPHEMMAWVSAPPADYDLDGRVDLFLDYFFDPSGVHLLRNTTRSGHWLAVSVDSRWATGPGTVVEVFEQDALGDASRLIGRRTIAASEGYTSGVVAEARFGLGSRTRVDVRITTPEGTRRVVELRHIAVDRHLRLPTGCSRPDTANTKADTLDVTGIELQGDQPRLGGSAMPVEVTLVNHVSRSVLAEVTLDAPQGWTASSVSVELAANEQQAVTVMLTPPAETPSAAHVTARVHAFDGGRQVASGWPSLFQLHSVPPPQNRVWAIDPGTADSPVATGFEQLAPGDAWSEDRNIGWLDGAPDALDRGAPGNFDRLPTDRLSRVDALRRDFVHSPDTKTLRLRVPPGEHTLYILTGDDIWATTGLTVSVDGKTAARQAPTVGPRVYDWMTVPLDGGTTGALTDLTFTGGDGGAWNAGAFILT